MARVRSRWSQRSACFYLHPHRREESEGVPARGGAVFSLPPGFTLPTPYLVTHGHIWVNIENDRGCCGSRVVRSRCGLGSMPCPRPGTTSRTSAAGAEPAERTESGSQTRRLGRGRMTWGAALGRRGEAGHVTVHLEQRRGAGHRARSGLSTSSRLPRSSSSTPGDESGESTAWDLRGVLR
jgi:hypothetical protein